MRISAKGRYALAVLVRMAQSGAENVLNVTRLSEELGLSRVYLEQVVAPLKRAGLLLSTKGAQGGYRLAVPPEQVTALDILRATDTSLLEQPGKTLLEGQAPEIEAVLEHVGQRLQDAVEQTLSGIRLSDLVERAAHAGGNYMFFI